jgi:rhodanese-related sulfurtransferase
MGEDAFVVAVTERQPARPRYFAFDARANREPHALLDEHPPARLGLDDVLARREAGAVLLDPSEPADFAVAHLAGAVNIGLQGRFAEWAGAILPPGGDIVLAGDPALAAEAKVRLAWVGLDRVVGQLANTAGVFTGRPELVEASSRLTIGQLAELRGLEPDLQLVDVRAAAETATGTIPGAIEIPLAVFADSLDALDRDLPVVIYCASGYRSPTFPTCSAATAPGAPPGFPSQVPATTSWRAKPRRSVRAPRRPCAEPGRCSWTSESPANGRTGRRPARCGSRWVRSMPAATSFPAITASSWCAAPAAAPRTSPARCAPAATTPST